MIGKQQRIEKGRLLKTLDSLQKEFNVTFEFKAESYNDWGSILRLMIGNSKMFSWGNRIPIVFYKTSQEELHVYMSINEDAVYLFVKKDVAVNKWHSVGLSQVAEGDAHRYSFEVDGFYKISWFYLVIYILHIINFYNKQF